MEIYGSYRHVKVIEAQDGEWEVSFLFVNLSEPTYNDKLRETIDSVLDLIKTTCQGHERKPYLYSIIKDVCGALEIAPAVTMKPMKSVPEGYEWFMNTACQYYPCHNHAYVMNCMFCYCPLYNEDTCGGNHSYANKSRIKDCSKCLIPHTPEGREYIVNFLKKHPKTWALE